MEAPSSPQLDIIFFFIKNTKKQLLTSKWVNNKSCFKKSVRTFSKNYSTQENIRIPTLKRDCKDYQKRKIQARN